MIASLSLSLAVFLATTLTFAADAIVVGQRDYYGTLPNNAYPIQSSVASPVSIASYFNGSAQIQVVSDQGNNRVLIFQNGITAGASVVIGQRSMTTGSANLDNGTPNASSLNAPSQVAIQGSTIVVADTGNNRVLIWNSIPTTHFKPADVVLGQANFTSNLQNGTGGSVNSKGFYAPRGVAIINGKLAVSDTYNNRVLIWNSIPTSSYVAADVVVGQADFTSYGGNRNGSTPTATSLYQPWYLSGDSSGRLVVADTFNNRILIWNAVPTAVNVAANVVLGQASFTSTGRALTATGLFNPVHAIVTSSGTYVADYLVNRITHYSGAPSIGQAANGVLGQPSLTSGDGPNNYGAASAQTLDTPLGMSIDNSGALWVADSNNNRILGYSASALVFPNSARISANSLFGQTNYSQLMANQKAVDGTSFDGISCLALSSKYLIVGDLFNSRVLVFDKNNPQGPPVSVIGQIDTTSHCAAYKRPAWPCRPTSATTLGLVTGCAVDSQDRLYISSKAENRVLVYNTIPTTNGAAASFVLGQDTFTTSTTNAGTNGAGWLNQPRGLSASASTLYVSDTGNNRVLAYSLPITQNHQAATQVLGHADFTTVATETSSVNDKFAAPSSVTVDSANNKLYIYSSTKYKFYAFKSIPTANGAAADWTFGGGHYPSPGWFTADSIDSGYMPIYPAPLTSGGPNGRVDSQITLGAMDGYIFVPDQTANRLLGFDFKSLKETASAIRVAGQADFASGASIPYASSGTMFNNLIGVNAFIADSNGQDIWVAEAGANRISRINRFNFANYNRVAAKSTDSTCLGYDPTVYHAFAYEKWPIQATLRATPVANLAPQFKPRAVPSVDCLLRLPQNSALLSAVLGQTGQAVSMGNSRSYTSLPYISWTAAQQQDLQNAFAIAWNWYENNFSGNANITMTDPPNNLVGNEANAIDTMTVISIQDGWNLYISHLAQALAAEFGRWVPWSLRDGTDIASMLDIRELGLFSWVDKSIYGFQQSYDGFWLHADTAGDILPNQQQGYSLPAPPSVEFSFLLNNDLLRATRARTIARLTEWSRDNLQHSSAPDGGSAFSASTMMQVWQYHGIPPVSRVISGTTDATAPAPQNRHWTLGCHGTSAFFKSILRTVNIAARFYWHGHSFLYFPSEQTYFSHSDDPYATRMASYSLGEQLFVDSATWNSWLGPSVDPTTFGANVGRRIKDISLTSPGDYLIGQYCFDTDNGKSHSAGVVASFYSGLYTVTQLEAFGLYTTMDQRIASTPTGCTYFKNYWITH
jgi:sugar lactone lactonase YvrE